MRTFLTFFPAIIGYAGLTLLIAVSLKEKYFLLILRFTSIIIFFHVSMVWISYYDFQFSTAVRNGYSGFIIFHSALLMIMVSNFIKQNISNILLKFSFLLIAAGAIGAVFKYEAVSIYKVPVLIISFAGMIGLFIHHIPFFRRIAQKIIMKKLPGKVQ